MTIVENHTEQVSRGERFEFGENWHSFLADLDAERRAEARRSLQVMLEVESLEGRTMLDIGCGSGLFSLAAVELGARLVHSIDFDPVSVRCARELKREFAPDRDWEAEEASVLDRPRMESLGQFDVVYAWGVLHHTGDMQTAMANAALAVAPGGRLFISIYNDQGWRSRAWRVVKRTYNELPPSLRLPFLLLVIGPREGAAALKAVVRLQPLAYLRRWTEYKRSRGMSRWHDLVDWCGGYPFEVATPESIFEFYRDRGFTLDRMRTRGGGLGCNEFVFSKPA